MRTEKDDRDLLNLHTVAFKLLIPGCVSVYIIHSIYQLNLKDTKHKIQYILNLISWCLYAANWSVVYFKLSDGSLFRLHLVCFICIAHQVVEGGALLSTAHVLVEAVICH